MINILERQLLWDTLRFHIPMLICATWVIISQRKIIWTTLKRWSSWGLRNWTEERKNYMMMLALGVLAFVLTIFIAQKTREEQVIKQRQEVAEKMLEEKVITPQELQEAQEKQQKKKNRTRKERNFSSAI